MSYTDDIPFDTEDATCKRCGKEGLFWRGDPPQLFEDRPHGSIAKHICNHAQQFEDQS